jgi:hypothetical protein
MSTNTEGMGVPPGPEVAAPPSPASPAVAQSPPGLPRWALVGIAAAIVVAVVWPVAFAVYLGPRFDHEPKITIPPDNDSPPPPFVPAAVNLTPSEVLTGTAAGGWYVVFCGSGSAAPGSTWICAFTMKYNSTNPNCYSVVTIDQVKLSGGSEASLTPSTPQTVCYGGTIGFAVGVSVPSIGVTTLAFSVIIDSHT